MAGALDGVRVIEFSSYITGPFAGMLLGDMGAEVIKVEAPPYGDPFRGTGKAPLPIFCSINRNKKSVALNLKTPAGRDAFLKLADDAAVVIQNHRPGYVDYLGIGYDAVSARNPSIVYCSISGFGEDGPYRDLPGYDVIGMSMGGLQSVLTDVANPKPAEISFGDHLTGIFANYGILSALYRRAVTGKGQRVDTSLLQSMVAFMGDTVAGYSATGKLPQVDGRGGRTRQAHCFLGSDGLPFSIHLSSPLKFFKGLMEAIGKPELFEDPRFYDREPPRPELRPPPRHLPGGLLDGHPRPLGPAAARLRRSLWPTEHHPRSPRRPSSQGLGAAYPDQAARRRNREHHRQHRPDVGDAARLWRPAPARRAQRSGVQAPRLQRRGDSGVGGPGAGLAGEGGRERCALRCRGLAIARSTPSDCRRVSCALRHRSSGPVPPSPG